MRILIIAPSQDLSTQAEIIAASSNKAPTILSGMVTRREVLSHIASGNYDSVHFGGHGTNDALVMSDGVISDSELELAFSRAYRKGDMVRVVLLNACRSIAAATRLHSMANGGPSYVIGWRDDVDDDAAGAFAVSFWSSLNSDTSPHDAYDIAVSALERKHPDSEKPYIINGIRAALHELIMQTGSDARDHKEAIEKLRNEARHRSSVRDRILYAWLGTSTILMLLIMAFLIAG